MATKKYPTFAIADLWANKLTDQILNADRFKKYLSVNPHLNSIHGHTFYHLVYFTRAKGSQVIDFVQFPVQPGMIYFMNPSQVHKWNFKGDVDGFIINFSATFFEQLHLNSQLLNLFPFFNGDLDQQVFLLAPHTRPRVTAIFENIMQEQQKKLPAVHLIIATYLLQLFTIVQRDMMLQQKTTLPGDHNTTLSGNFKKLVDQKFREIRLPKQYAALLYITPNHLNALCKTALGIAAGEVIRNRIMLEAKRLLVNFSLSVNDISAILNFQDTSYFVKFFKKYAGVTPETFRQEHYGKI